MRNSLPQSQTLSQKHACFEKLPSERFLVLKMELLVKRKHKLLVLYWSKTIPYTLIIRAKKKLKFQCLTSYMNMLICGLLAPHPFLIQNKNTSMFLAKQFFLPPPGLPYNVNGKCAPQNRNREDWKFSFIFPQFCVCYHLEEESRGISVAGCVWDNK